jgi:hypothetical protein
MAGLSVSVRTVDLAGRPCRLRDVFTQISLANGEVGFDALVQSGAASQKALAAGGQAGER